MQGSGAAEALRVTRLRIYPVKGGAGTDLPVMEFDEVGPRFDRRWMVTGEDGGFVTQRQVPRLATLRPRLQGDSLVLNIPGMEPLVQPARETRGPTLRVRIWDSELNASVVASRTDAWLSAALGGKYRLVYIGEQGTRMTDPAYAKGHRVGFADGYPVLFVTEGSAEELARRAGRRVPIERFRANIVVGGARPHAEDRWRRLAIGDLAFDGVKLCARCKVTTIDQNRGTPDPDSEPLRTLARYRRIEGRTYFGLNAVHQGTGRIGVGDLVTIVERGTVPGAFR